MSEWERCLLGELITFGNGKARPKSDGNVPVYGGNGILAYANQANYDDETIVIGRVGAYCGATYYEKGEIWVSDNALSAKAKNDNYPKFLYYFLLNLDLNQFAQGSSHPLLTQTLLNSIEVETTTNISEQQAIASILSALDDKIDLLQRQNQTLEQMAATLFWQWFIEEAKEDWEEVTLDKIVSHFIDYRGKTPSKADNGIPLVTAKIVKNGRIKTPTEFIAEEDYASWMTRGMPELNDVVLTTEAPLGEVALIRNTNVALAQRIITMRCNKSKFDNVLLKYFLLSDEGQYELDSRASGTTVFGIKASVLKKLPIKLPSLAEQKVITSQLNLLEDKMHSNEVQISILENMRDTLLPKLISGEVRLKGFETVLQA